MRKFLNEMVIGTDNRVSSKRVITLIAFVLCAIAFVCNIFLEIPLRDYVWEGMLYLVGAGLGFSTVEHFVPLANRKDRNRHRGNHQYNHYRNDNYDEDDYNEDDCDEDKDHRGRKNYRKNN
jgi:hypothetical protein